VYEAELTGIAKLQTGSKIDAARYDCIIDDGGLD
jgi:hypothetical protein